MFNIISARQIQRGYKKILEQANETQEPIIVMSNNKPLGAIIGVEMLEKIQLEFLLKQALGESKLKKTKTVMTAEDLEEDFKDLEKHATSSD